MIAWVDEYIAYAPIDICFRTASEVERWPLILPHYRWVHFHQRDEHGGGVVEMATWRIFAGPLRCPIWWLAEMVVDQAAMTIDYRHIKGVTKGMVARWEIVPDDVDTRMRITQTWESDDRPLLRESAWRYLIGALSFRDTARRSLAGIAAEAQRLTHQGHHLPTLQTQ